MENLVKTTNISFETSKGGYRASVSATKDIEGNITNIRLNQIQTSNGMWIGDLNFNGDASEQIAAIEELVNQALTETEEA